MNAMKFIAVICVAIVVLLIVGPFFADRTPAAYVEAQNNAIRIQPTATAEALVNQAQAVRDAIIVPVQATAEAASILANNQQRIDEDAHQQALRHAGEMAALNISNTLRLDQVQADYTASIEGIKANGAKTVAEVQADAQRASAGAWRDTVTYGAIAIGAIVLLLGGTLAIVWQIATKPKIVKTPTTGPILISKWGVVMLGNVTTPALAWENRYLSPAGESNPGLVAQRQAFALISQATRSADPEMAQVAERAATTSLQRNWTPDALTDSAVQALPAGRDELAGRVPNFSTLLQTWRPSLSQMLLGIGRDGSPRYCMIDALLSTGIIGMPGSGKSTVLRFHYLQCRLVGARVIVWDIHRTIVKTLPGAEAFTNLDTITQSTHDVQRILRDRISHDRYNDTPIMLLIDEFNMLAPQSQEVVDTLSSVILEGRKVRMYAMVSGQGLPARLFGGSTVREALSSRFILHTTTHQAEIAGLDRDARPWVVRLPIGSAVVDGPIDPEVLSIPNVTEADIRALLPTSGAASRATSEPLPVWTVATSEKAEKSGESGKNESQEVGEIDPFEGVEVSSKRETVRKLLKQNKSQREIISEVWGATGGNAYTVAAQELRDIIRELIP